MTTIDQPTVTITQAPPATTDSTDATVAFTTSGAKKTTCQLDQGTPQTCRSPITYHGLANGDHTFTVRVTNRAGSATDSTSWKVGAAPGGSDPLIPASGALLGAWHKDPPTASWSQTGLTSFETQIGRKLNIDHRFASWGTTYWPGADEAWDVSSGRIPMISLGGTSSFPGLGAINNGSQDAWLAGQADKLKAFGHQIFLRPLWEMNGSWFPWDGTHNNSSGQTDGPAKYVNAWRRMNDIFRQHGATNVVWVWAPDCGDNPTSAWNHWTNYYPGDAYVDWVGCDGYNWGTSQTWSSWKDFADIFGTNPGVYGDYPHKPFMAAETGSCEQGGSKAQWIANAQSAMKSAQFSRIKAFVWFDEFKEAAVNCDWRVNSSQPSLDAFRALAADPYFQG